MNLDEYSALDGLALAELVRARQVTAAELSVLARDAAAQINPKINAVVELWEDDQAVLETTAETTFSGVPFLLKDMATTLAGRQVEFGSRLAAGLTAQQDSALAVRFRRAGLNMIGRTTMPEFAASTTTESAKDGATANPWNLRHGVGGSSGGSAAAVAAGIVPLAHATDAAGSIRIPAAQNGLVGLKPSRGRTSHAPAAETMNGMAAQFAVSRTVRDSAALLDAVQGAAPGDPFVIAPPRRAYLDELGAEPVTLRIGLLVDPANGSKSSPQIAAAIDEVARTAERLGHSVEPFSLALGLSWQAYVEAITVIWAAHAAPWIAGVAEATGRLIDESTVEPAMLALYRYGKSLTATDLVRAEEAVNLVSRSVAKHFERHHLILSPTLPQLAPELGEYNAGQSELDGPAWIRHVLDEAPFTVAANLTGTPAISLPLAQDAATGLPIAAQFWAAFGREDLLFNIAGQFEQGMPWQQRRPKVWPASVAE
ncbi:amidase [Psychromicrobium lacuslunae]|uniref:6-aminohexanoate hydrolase n=1 Tax=Psychromicrobium lacuslunae TaxID=1618207 RepID=A0A0D4BXM3_9MICC|nr:amidase family protein [Psychromicrobium lacuslunae]AJT41063.1 6-aminohexanoate hydrolase [Psychromicrobium lacuslunae]